MSNMSDLYNEVINDHRKFPRNKGLIEKDGYQTIHVRNSSCGDDIKIQVFVEDGIVKDVRQEGTGCVICCSSASVMTEVLKGKPVQEAIEIINDFYVLIKGNMPADEDRLQEAIVYHNIHNFPPRAKCATLAWRAAGALLIGTDKEGDDFGNKE
jgi:SUF system NifU family Fe-S assembly protein